MKRRYRIIKKSPSPRDGLLFRLVILAVSIILLCLIWVYRDELENLSRYGYAGLFIVNFISAATVLLPTPGTASVFLGGALWNPLIVGVVSGLGSSIGELFAYFLGFGGRGLLKTDAGKNEWIKRVEGKFHKSGFWTTFIFAVLPLPVFDVIGLIAGAFNYPVSRFLLAVTLGRVLRNIIFAFTGAKLLP